MVVHLSSKLSHLAQSFRPQHHFNTLRSAFPSSTHHHTATSTASSSTGFFDPANVFTQQANSALNTAAAAHAANNGNGSAQQATGGKSSSGSTAGGAGGAKWHAGRNAYNWGLNSGRSSMAQVAPTSADPNTKIDDENNTNIESALLEDQVRRRNLLLSNPRSYAPSSLRFEAPPSTIAVASVESMPPNELLAVDEIGLRAPRLSSVEMQMTYRSAFAEGKKTRGLKAMELEADEMDLGEQSPSSVRRTGRRASISSGTSTPKRLQSIVRPYIMSAPSVSSSHLFTLGSSQRLVHNQASQPQFTASISSSAPSRTNFPSTEPPRATVPRLRRYSTSAVEASSPATDTSSPPLADNSFGQEQPRARTRGQKVRAENARPPTSNPNDQAFRPQMLSRIEMTKETAVQQLRSAGKSNDSRDRGRYTRATDAVRSYLAVEQNFSVDGHNAAMELLLKARMPNTPITSIVDLYNQLFEHESLRPNRKSYEFVLRAFCDREREVLDNIRALNNRIERRKVVDAAKGPGWGDGPVLTTEETQALEALKQENYLNSALEIYKSLGPLADKLDSQVVSSLVRAASLRGRVDVALSLFGRMERSRFQEPATTAYISLIDMFAEQKDRDSLMDVFEGYLEACADPNRNVPGSGSAARSAAPRVNWQRLPLKHAYSTTPEYAATNTAFFFRQGDDAVWRHTIWGLFKAGDSAEAITVLERMLLAQNSEEKLPVGYPREFGPDMLAVIVSGFCDLRDEASAQKWFDQAANISGSNGGIPPAFFSMTLNAAMRNDMYDLVRSAYFATLDNASATHPLSIANFVSFVDSRLALTHETSATVEQRQQALEDIAVARTRFEQFTKQGLVFGIPGNTYTISTGVLGRIFLAAATHEQWNLAMTSFSELASAAAAAAVQAAAFRTPLKWATHTIDLAARSFGLERADTRTWAQKSNSSALPISFATQVVADVNKVIRNSEKVEIPHAMQVIVVDTYLKAKAQEHGDVEALKLSGEQWYAVIDAFASVSAQIRRGLEVSFEFPGFEPIIDDFAAAGVKIPSSLATSFPSLVKSLVAGQMSKDRALSVIAVLDINLARELQAEQDARERAEAEAAAAALASAETLASPSSSGPDSMLSNDSVGSGVSTLATPPSTPPPYILEQRGSELPTVTTIDTALSKEIDQLVYNQQLEEAFKVATQAAQQGRFAHPEALGRLLEDLGRKGDVNSARQTYALAYASLPALASSPAEQSLAWTLLEDHMIVALAQAGQLTEVGQHRDRLVQAGSAPSADGYAAMILNMKETTNDAAVALALFEESQRFGVPANVYLFNTVISKLSRARRAKDALEYFELMKSQGLKPSAITYGAIINACCKTGDDASADYLFREMVASPNFKPRVPPYNTMIQFYTATKPDRARALHYYRQLLDAKVQPTGHTYKLLLDAYGSIEEPDYASLEDVFRALLTDKAVSVTGAHWASLINSYGSVGKDLEKAMQLFDSIPSHPSTMQSKANLPDAVVYESLLNAFLANGRADLCENYLVEMKERGVKMTAYVANTLIKGHAAQNNLNSARAVFEAMQDPPSGVAAAGNHSVDRHPKQQQQHQQNSAATGPVYREPSTYEAMIKVELEAGEAKRALDLFKRVEERALPEAVVARIRKHLESAGLVTRLDV